MAALAKHQKIKEPFCFQRQHWAWNGRLPPAALLPSRLERFWTSFHQHQRVGLGWFLRALVLHAEAAAGTHDPLGRFRVPFSVFFRFLRPESLADVAGGGAAGGRVRPRWTWLENWVLLRFTGLFGGFTRIYLVLPTFYWVSPSCTGFYRVLPSFAGFYRVLTAFYCFFRVGTRFYLVLLGFTGFYRVSTRFYRVLFGFTEFRRVLLGFSEF